jgi:hypothetical protein
LESFVEEVNLLKTKGIEVSMNTVKPFELRALIADSPGQALVVCCKYPTAFKGCTKCEQIGTRIENTNVFANKSGDPRTDKSFELRTDTGHHNKEFLQPSSTPLEKIGFGMVSQVPIDVMHCVDLGVVKKLMHLITTNKCKAYLDSNELVIYMEQTFLTYKVQLGKRENWVSGKFRFYSALKSSIFFLISGKCFLH